MAVALSKRIEAWRTLNQAGVPAWVPPHCLAVEALALAMCDCAEAAGGRVDRAVVSQGAILHDIGRAQAQDVRHASLGAAMLRDAGWDARVVTCVERHTGAGIEPHEAAALGIPVRDYTPQTLEERIVAHADNLYSGIQRLTITEVRAKYERKGLASAWAKIEALHNALGKELATDLEALQPCPMPPLPSFGQ